ncbi:MAG: Fic family protein [Sporolactobacillus sp.]
MTDFSLANSLKDLLDQQRPLTKGEAARIASDDRISMVYNSNALEGNSLTPFETKMVLQNGITVGKKPLKDYLEAVDLNEAADYIEGLASKKQRFTERDLKQVHYLVFKSTSREDAGAYRRVAVEISGSQHQSPEPLLVQEKMTDLFSWLHKNEDVLHPIELAAVFHHRLTSIHPFINGNGRTARLAMNLLLMQHGYPPVIVKASGESEVAYYQTLESGDTTGDREPFVSFIKETEEQALMTYLDRLQVDYSDLLLTNGPSISDDEGPQPSM